MMVINTVLSILLPICFGAFLKIFKIFKENDSAVLRKFIIKATVPFIIFRNLYSAQISELNQILPSFLGFFLITVLYFIFSILISRWLVSKEEEKHSFSLSTMFGNYGYMGWGVVQNFYGQQGLTRSIFFTMFFWPVFLVMGFLYLFLGSEGKISKKTMVQTIVKNASIPISSALLGITFNLLQIKIPEVLHSFISQFAGITIPGILFTIGLELNFQLEKGKINLILLSSFIRLFIGQFFGFLTLFILKYFLSIDPLTMKVVLLESVMPTATMVPFFSDFAHTDKQLTSSIITFSTLLSLGTLPLWYFLIDKIIYFLL